MAGSPHIVVTNDDGIDSPGIRALADALREVGDVTVVAPANDQSAVGRAMSSTVELDERENGYAIAGTPSDCVVAALGTLVPDADLVVSGVNAGANLGMYVLGRSGTVSAAVEAAFFDVPAIAVSLYVPESEWPRVPDPEEFGLAVDAARYLAERGPDAGVFAAADYLNVNAPLAGDGDAEMVVTEPSTVYAMDAAKEEGQIHLHDDAWEHMETGDLPDPPGTDRRVVADGDVSVSPLTAPHTTEHHEALDELVTGFPGRVSSVDRS